MQGARDDARHVEEVLDQARLQHGVALDHLEGSRGGGRVELLGPQYPGPPEHRGQRRAQLVRQDCHELVLGPGRRLRLGAHGPLPGQQRSSLALDALSLGDVPRNPGHADNLAGGVADRRGGERDVQTDAVLPDTHGFVADSLTTAKPGHEVDILVEPLGRNNNGDRSADHLIRRVPEQPLSSAVP